MNRLRAKAGVLLVLLGTALLASGAAAAPATSIADQGWWWRLQTNSQIVEVPPPADVTEDQLLVEAFPDGASAIAAIRFTVADGQANPVLALTAASETAGDMAVVLACQTGSGWTGADAGAWDAKPSPDCASSVQGVRSADGTEWTFALAALQFDGDQVDIVITPGANPDGTVTPFRIVFDAATPASVETTSTGTSESGASFAPQASAAPVGGAGGGSFSPPQASGGSNFTPPPSPPTADSLATQPARAALPPDEQGQTATAPVLNAPTAPRALPISSSDSGPSRLLAVAIILGGGAVLWWSSRQAVPEPRSLSRFAARPPVATANQARLVGRLGLGTRGGGDAPRSLR